MKEYQINLFSGKVFVLQMVFMLMLFGGIATFLTIKQSSHNDTELPFILKAIPAIVLFSAGGVVMFISYKKQKGMVFKITLGEDYVHGFVKNIVDMTIARDAVKSIKLNSKGDIIIRGHDPLNNLSISHKIEGYLEIKEHLSTWKTIESGGEKRNKQDWISSLPYNVPAVICSIAFLISFFINDYVVVLIAAPICVVAGIVSFIMQRKLEDRGLLLKKIKWMYLLVSFGALIKLLVALVKPEALIRYFLRV